MAATISVGGIEISVPTEELGLAIQQLAPLFDVKLKPTVAPIRLGAWSMPTGQPASPAGVRGPLLRRSRPATPAPSTETGDTDSASGPVGDDDDPVSDTSSPLERASRFVHLLLDHARSGGVTAAEVMSAVGAVHPKGIGSRMQAINTFFKVHGLEPHEVYTNDRDETGARGWRAGPQIELAVAAVEEAMQRLPAQKDLNDDI